MNKKGQIEMADLAGFVLIFIAVIVFGFVYSFLSPKAGVEVITAESNYFPRQELVQYLNYEEDGKNMADLIVLAVKNNDFVLVEEKTKKLLDDADYKLVIYQDENVLKEIGTGRNLKKSYNLYLEDFYGTNIHITMNLVGVKMI